MEASVIIACRNGAATIGETLEGLAAQVWDRPWEVVLADNGSTDGTAALFDAFARSHPRFRRIEAGGRPCKSHALNRGIAAARGRYLLLCDDDDVPAPGWLAAMGAALDAHPLVACHQEYDRLNPAHVLRDMRIEPGTRKAIHRLGYPPFLETAGGGTLGLHRAVIEAVGGFDESAPAHEDLDFCIRAWYAGYGITPVEGAVLHVRLRATPMAVFAQAEKYARGRAMLRKRYGKPGPMLAPGPWIALGADLVRVGGSRLLTALGRPTSPEKRRLLERRLGSLVGDVTGALVYRVSPPEPRPRPRRAAQVARAGFRP